MDHLLRLRATAVFFRTALIVIVLTAAPTFALAAAQSFSLPSQTALPAPLSTTADSNSLDDVLSDAGPAEPLLTILYNADTYGETQPCPT